MNLGTTYAGDTLVIDFELKTATGAAEDLSGATVRFGLSRTDCLAASVLTKTTVSGITLTDAVNGKGYITIGKGELTATGRLRYEIEAVLDSGESYTYAQGYLMVREAMFATI